MTQPGTERDCDHAKLLLEEYSFDLSGFAAGQLVAIWQERLGAEPSWIRSAVIEALFLGRYKAFSVEQILQGWKRRGHPVRHFNSEFERVVFGPIDPTISKYAAMTTLSPSQLMSPQTDSAPSSQISTAVSAAETDQSKTPQMADRVGDQPEAAADSIVESPAAAAPAQGAPPSDLVGGESKAVELPVSGKNNAATDETTQTATIFNQPEPIQKFTPDAKSSEFYERLQAVARQTP